MHSRWFRLGAVSVLSAFLLVFFVPFIPVQAVAPAVSCGEPVVISFGPPCGPAVAVPPGSLNYLSLGIYLLHWGASNTYLGGYSPPIITYSSPGGVATFTSFGALFFVVLPIIAVTLALLGFRRLTVLTSLSLLGWGLLITFVSVQEHTPVLIAYGYVMALSSGAVVVAEVWGRRITGYWNIDSEALPPSP